MKEIRASLFLRIREQEGRRGRRKEEGRRERRKEEGGGRGGRRDCLARL
jgi:hypothetical protein